MALDVSDMPTSAEYNAYIHYASRSLLAGDVQSGQVQKDDPLAGADEHYWWLLATLAVDTSFWRPMQPFLLP